MRTSQLFGVGELLRHDITDKICQIDASREAQANRNAFLVANSDQYYVAINLWLLLILETAGDAARFRIAQRLVDYGLISTIGLAADTADYVIAVLNGDSVTPSNDVISLESLFGCVDVRDLLLCLRFLKRFTLDESNRLTVSTAKKFKAVQDRLNWRYQERTEGCKMYTRDPSPTCPTNRYVPRVQWYMSKLTKNWKKYLDEEHGSFSSGVCSDAKNLAQKLDALFSYIGSRENCNIPFSCPTKKWKVPKAIAVKCVPKSYKTYRIIAPEPSYTVYYLQALRKALVVANEKSGYIKYIDVTDQIRQQERARLGSIDGSFITYDLSGASDGIALYWMRQVLDRDLFDYISSFRPSLVEIPGVGRVPYSTFLTSGNPCTFILEDDFFWSLAMTARDLHHYWTSEWCAIPSTFGDDLIVDARMKDEMETLLDAFGCVINYSKSFTRGLYRESCGVEFYDGQPLHSRYWPRAGILTGRTASATDYASLVSLQHKVFDHPRAAGFLESVIRCLWPRATSSIPGLVGAEGESPDIWSHFPKGKRIKAPSGYNWPECHMYPTVDPEREAPFYYHYYGKYVRSYYDPDHKVPMPIDRSVMEREAHYGLRIKDKESVQIAQPTLSGTWLYTEYLLYGPMYASKLDELLRVSTPRSVALYDKDDLTLDWLT